MKVRVKSFAGLVALMASAAVTAQVQPATTPTTPAQPSATAPGQIQSTPGQAQTSPGEASTMTPAQTGQTPSGQSVPNAAVSQPQAGQLTTATLADAKAGVSVYDQKGGTVGKIVSATAKGVVVDTGTVKAAIPLSSFGKSDKGLVISMTREEIDAAAKKKSGK